MSSELVMAPILGLLAAICAAAPLEKTGRVGTWGRFLRSHSRHWARGWAWEATVWMSSMLPERQTRLWEMGSWISPQILTLYFIKESRVEYTAPSMEFSTGTTP